MPVSYQKYGLRGLERVMHRLNEEIKGIENRSIGGLILAANEIGNDCKDGRPPLVPIAEKYGGNLINSWFVSPQLTKNDMPIVVLGFHAFYAVFVHEMIGAHFHRPGAGPKFLQASVHRNTGRVLDIIRNAVKLP